MTQTKAGSKKAMETIYEKYGKDHFKKIGALGGKNGHKGGFWYTKHIKGQLEPIREAGRKGGEKSSRLGIKNGEGRKWQR